MELHFKPGVTLEPHPAGIRILGAIDRVAMNAPHDITITSGSEAHAINDVHTRGCAFDLRTHDLDDSDVVAMMHDILAELSEDPAEPLTIDGVHVALATDQWFIQWEHYLQPTSHVHVQLRKGVPFP